jgi:hypothetical protein
MTMHLPRRLAAALVRIGLTLLGALTLVGLVAHPVLGASPTVRLQALAGDDGAWILTAQADDARGNPAAGIDIDFDVTVTFLGSERVVSIGTASTDTSGAATISYVPTWTGHQVLTAGVAGDDGTASAPAGIDVAAARPVLAPEPPSLGLLRSIAPPVGILAAVVVWLVLIATFLYAVFGIAGSRRTSPQRPRHATTAVVAGLGEER